MSAKILSKMYYNPKNYGSLGRIKQFVMRAREL